MADMMGILASVARYARKAVSGRPEKPPEADEALSVLPVQYTTTAGLRLTAPQLKAILDSAGDGSAADQAALFLDMREKEPLIEAHLGTRRMAVTGAPWQLTSKAHGKQAEELTGLLLRAGIGGLVGHLADAVPTGYAGAVIDWEEGGRDIRGFVPIHPTAFEFDQAGNPAVTLITGGTRGLAEFHPWQFAFCRASGRPGIPTRTGLMRSLAWLWLFKHEGYRNWNRFVEKFGIPFIVGKLPDALWSDKTKRNDLLAALKRIGTDSAGVTAQGAEIEFLNTAQSGNADVFERLCRYLDELATLLILGQLATAQAGSGLSQGGMQESVRQDLAAADAAMLSEVIRRDVVEPLARLRYGWEDGRDLAFEIDTSPAEDLKAKAATYKLLTEVTGRYLDGAQIEAEFDVKLGESVAAQPSGAPLVDLADTAAAGARERALEAIVADALQKTTLDREALAAWMGPVQDAIREAFAGLAPDDVEGFKARIPRFLEALPGVLGDMDATGFERALSGAMLAAVVNGYAEGAH